ncbi:MAG TPA: Fur family transcriptional regulator [Polyangiaceae bacterium]|nr:Fur family transcriptional regulator [Polyangiaceae bacterium]
MRALADVMAACRTRGVRLTPQRLAIFDYLVRNPGHPTAEDVYQDVVAKHPTLSFATVYNTLELLVEMSEVRIVIVDELRRRYDVNTEPHQHAICRRCRRIMDVRDNEIGDRLRSALAQVDLRSSDFTVEAASVEFSGICGACARQT